jgi:hypothetical protein
MATAFPADAWHGDAPAADRHHNQPPLEERLVMEFEDELRDDKLIDRINQIVASAGRAPAIDSAGVAGQVGDLIALARTCRKEVEARRENHNRPLLTAQRALKGRADALLAPMDAAINRVKGVLDAFMAEEARKAAEARAEAERQARLAREAAEQAAREAIANNEPTPPPAPPVIEPARVEQPVARGDLGARVGTRTVWRHRIESVRQLPDAILKNERVIEALDKVVAAQIRGGARVIKGVTIWDEQVADVR